MSIFREYAIALVKLIIPEKIKVKKVTLSVTLPEESLFIKQERSSKNNTINLFR